MEISTSSSLSHCADFFYPHDSAAAPWASGLAASSRAASAHLFAAGGFEGRCSDSDRRRADRWLVRGGPAILISANFLFLMILNFKANQHYT